MAIAFFLTCLSLSAPTPDTVVVCPAEFRAALQPWVEHRASQGHEVAVVSNEGTAEDVQRRISEVAGRGAVRYVVLIGDAEPTAILDDAARLRSTPTHFVDAKVNVLWGSEPEIAADNLYGDFDGDDVPDAAVGRLPVDSAEELTAAVQKIIAYETAASLGPWRRQVNFVAGVGGFGSMVDSVLESCTKRFLTEGIPTAYRTTVTYGSWRSPLCPDPRRFQHAALNRFNEGCLFWVYIGHGQRQGLDTVNTPAGRYPILSAADAIQLRAEQAPPIAVFLACYTGAFDGGRDCLAEEMLRSPGGPVAVLAGSRVTMPYAMAVLGANLMDEVFERRRPTIGESLLHAKRRLVQSPADEEGRSE
ncbi:MAG: peptidase C25, partial [Planctomycetes bacterium]|nr:peptidase C25 [Planctomycetota bacterium]